MRTMQVARLAVLLAVSLATFDGSWCLIGGNGTITKYPFMTSVRRLEAGLYEHICGGSLLSASWVLTAKQCVVDEEVGHLFTADNFHIFAGVDLIEPSSLDISVRTHLQKRAVRKVAALAPLEEIYQNDAALLKTVQPFDLTESVQPANVPWIRGAATASEDIADLFETCVMIGFGCEIDEPDEREDRNERDDYDDEYDDSDDDDDDDDYRKPPHTLPHETVAEHHKRFNFAEDSDGMLKAANVTLVPRSALSRMYMNDPPQKYKVLLGEIPESEVTACDGDYGGPLVCGDDGALYGVISRGDPDKYVVFTRVDFVAAWIAMLLQEDQDMENRSRNTKRNKKGRKKLREDDSNTAGRHLPIVHLMVVALVCSFSVNFSTIQ